MPFELIILIPARGGSKGLPNKNLKLFLDKPLIWYAINYAKKLDYSSKIIVSTDSPEIAGYVRTLGIDVPKLRPKYLAKDDSAMHEVIRYEIDMLNHNTYSETSLFLLLDPTSPIRNINYVYEAVNILKNNLNVNGVIGISRTFFNPDWVGVKFDKINKSIKPLSNKLNSPTNRQAFSPFFRINGSIYLWRIHFAKNIDSNYLHFGSFIGLETPEKFSYSIDSIEDFELAEVVFKFYQQSLGWLN